MPEVIKGPSASGSRDRVLCLTKWQTVTLSTYIISSYLAYIIHPHVYHGYLAAVVAFVCLLGLLFSPVQYFGRSFDTVSDSSVLVEPSATATHSRRVDKPSTACRTRDVLRDFVCVRPETDSEFDLSTDDEHFQRPVSSEPSPDLAFRASTHRRKSESASDQLRSEADQILQRARAEAAALTEAAALDCASMLEQTREDIRTQRACAASSTDEAHQVSPVEQMNLELRAEQRNLQHNISAYVTENLSGLNSVFMDMHDAAKLKITIPPKHGNSRPIVSLVVKSPNTVIAQGPIGDGFAIRRSRASPAPRCVR